MDSGKLAMARGRPWTPEEDALVVEAAALNRQWGRYDPARPYDQRWAVKRLHDVAERTGRGPSRPFTSGRRGSPSVPTRALRNEGSSPMSGIGTVPVRAVEGGSMAGTAALQRARRPARNPLPTSPLKGGRSQRVRASDTSPASALPVRGRTAATFSPPWKGGVTAPPSSSWPRRPARR